jgi:hypothetical protein
MGVDSTSRIEHRQQIGLQFDSQCLWHAFWPRNGATSSSLQTIDIELAYKLFYIHLEEK